MATIAHRLELDLDVFAGPFDLLLSLVLREELDLLERMLQYARFRGAGAWAAAAHADGQAFLHRAAPLPAALRRVSVEAAERAYDPAVLGQALGGLLRTPPPIDIRHLAAPRVSVAERLAHLRALLRR